MNRRHQLCGVHAVRAQQSRVRDLEPVHEAHAEDLGGDQIRDGGWNLRRERRCESLWRFLALNGFVRASAVSSMSGATAKRGQRREQSTTSGEYLFKTGLGGVQ